MDLVMSEVFTAEEVRSPLNFCNLMNLNSFIQTVCYNAFRARIMNKGLRLRVLTQDEVRNPPYFYSIKIIIPFMFQAILNRRLHKLVKGCLLALLDQEEKDRQEDAVWVSSRREHEEVTSMFLVGQSNVLLQGNIPKREAKVQEGDWAEMANEEIAREWAEIVEEKEEVEKKPAARRKKVPVRILVTPTMRNLHLKLQRMLLRRKKVLQRILVTQMMRNLYLKLPRKKKNQQ